MAVPIVRVTSDGLPQVVSMSARAFIDEAMFRWVLGEVGDPLSAVEAEFAAMDAVAAELGCLWEAGDALGAARWVSPEASPVYWERCKAFSSEGVGLAAYATDGGRRYEMLYECLDSHEPSEPVWTLDILTVEPTQQRGGIGSALVEHGLGLARESRCASFLDSSRPELVGYYARFGFVVTSEADLPDGGPHLWFMVARGTHLAVGFTPRNPHPGPRLELPLRSPIEGKRQSAVGTDALGR
jgi:GNAT superfamily N-acetyltransferase